MKLIPAKQREEFNIEIYELDWKQFVYKYISGLCVWCLKEQKISPEHDLQQVLSVNQFLPWTLEKAYHSYKQSELSIVPSLYQKTMFMTLNSILFKVMEGIYVAWNGFDKLIAAKTNKKYVVVLMNDTQNLDMLIMFYLNYTRLKSPGSFFHSGSLHGDYMKRCQFETAPKDKTMDK